MLARGQIRDYSCLKLCVVLYLLYLHEVKFHTWYKIVDGFLLLIDLGCLPWLSWFSEFDEARIISVRSYWQAKRTLAEIGRLPMSNQQTLLRLTFILSHQPLARFQPHWTHYWSEQLVGMDTDNPKHDSEPVSHHLFCTVAHLIIDDLQIHVDPGPNTTFGPPTAPELNSQVSRFCFLFHLVNVLTMF